MAPRGYPAGFRKRVVDLVEAGRPVAQVAAELGVSDQSIYTWRRQARIDAGADARLSAPRVDRLIADPQLRGDLSDRTTRLYQIDHTLSEPRGIPPRSHRTSQGP